MRKDRFTQTTLAGVGRLDKNGVFIPALQQGVERTRVNKSLKDKDLKK